MGEVGVCPTGMDSTILPEAALITMFFNTRQLALLGASALTCVLCLGCATRQDQELTFLFIGMPEENNTSDNGKKSLFPF